MLKPLDSLVIKPVGAFCNLRCDYCFYLEKRALYPEERTVSVMPEETAAELIRQTFRRSESPLFIWHGGEPTMAGLPFFKKIVERQKQEAEGRPPLTAQKKFTMRTAPPLTADRRMKRSKMPLLC